MLCKPTCKACNPQAPPKKIRNRVDCNNDWCNCIIRFLFFRKQTFLYQAMEPNIGSSCLNRENPQKQRSTVYSSFQHVKTCKGYWPVSLPKQASSAVSPGWVSSPDDASLRNPWLWHTVAMLPDIFWVFISLCLCFKYVGYSGWFLAIWTELASGQQAKYRDRQEPEIMISQKRVHSWRGEWRR